MGEWKKPLPILLRWFSARLRANRTLEPNAMHSPVALMTGLPEQKTSFRLLITREPFDGEPCVMRRCELFAELEARPRSCQMSFRVEFFAGLQRIAGFSFCGCPILNHQQAFREGQVSFCTSVAESRNIQSILMRLHASRCLCRLPVHHPFGNSLPTLPEILANVDIMLRPMCALSCTELFEVRTRFEDGNKCHVHSGPFARIVVLDADAHEALARRCVPLSHSVNDNRSFTLCNRQCVAMALSFRHIHGNL